MTCFPTTSAFVRTTLFAAAACLAGILPADRAFGQGDKGGELAKPEAQVIQTTDGFPIAITYYKSSGGKESPVVVLLHMKDGNRLVWEGDKGLASTLHKEGYAVITVDLHGHGDSKGTGIASATTTGSGNANQKKKDEKEKKPAPKATKASAGDVKKGDVEAMIGYDMEVVKTFIYERHQAQELNMNKLAVVGAEMGATVALNFAANDWLKKPHSDGQVGFQTPRGQDVRAIVLFSPQTGFAGVPVNAALNLLRTSYSPAVDPNGGVAFLVCVTKKDSEDRGQAKKIFDQLETRDNKDRMNLKTFEGNLRGTQMLSKNLKSGQLTLEEYIQGFFELHLKKLPPNWRDRQSKLEKKANAK
ncbi:MAG: alpha/beta hydrolase [Planctomycetales bacterium]|nr:alpha/beta hydrolase [Planctomycetales bacterium]